MKTRKILMLFAGLLMLSVGFTAPAWGKGHSPPGKETIKAPELIQAYVAIPVIEVNTDQTKTIAGVYTATNETTKEYASHITSVAFVPLYRWQEAKYLQYRIQQQFQADVFQIPKRPQLPGESFNKPDNVPRINR